MCVRVRALTVVKQAEIKYKLNTETEQGILKHLDNDLFIYLWFTLRRRLKLRLYSV
jgi:hypothetical protein